MCGLVSVGTCISRVVELKICRVVEKRVDSGCVWINNRVKERKIQIPKTREHEKREFCIDYR